MFVDTVSFLSSYWQGLQLIRHRQIGPISHLIPLSLGNYAFHYFFYKKIIVFQAIPNIIGVDGFDTYTTFQLSGNINQIRLFNFMTTSTACPKRSSSQWKRVRRALNFLELRIIEESGRLKMLVYRKKLDQTYTLSTNRTMLKTSKRPSYRASVLGQGA